MLTRTLNKKLLVRLTSSLNSFTSSDSLCKPERASKGLSQVCEKKVKKCVVELNLIIMVVSTW